MAFPILTRKADLELIIETFEKDMIKNRSLNSVFPIFRRHIEAQTGILQGSQNSAKVALSSSALTSRTATGEDLGVNTEPGELTDEPESKKDDEAEKLLEGCIPCDFRVMFEQDWEALKNFKTDMEAKFDQIEKNFKKFENLLDDTSQGEAFLKSFCVLGNAFQKQCVPDLKKLMFLVNFTLDRLGAGISIDTQVFSSAISMDLLGEIFSEALGIIDIIQDLGLNPMKCLFEQIKKMARDMANNTSEAQAAAFMMADRFHIDDAVTSSQNEAASAATRARAETAQRDVDNHMTQATEVVDRFLEETENILDLERFTRYISAGLQYFESTKNYLTEAINQIVNNSTDSFDRTFRFSNQKMDLLKYISIIKALIEAAGKGGITCGPDTSSMTEEEIRIIAGGFKYPDQDIELTVEDGNVVLRPTSRPDISVGGSDARLGSTSDIPSFEVTVATRPIDSCLGKVSNTDVDKVRAWINELSE